MKHVPSVSLRMIGMFTVFILSCSKRAAHSEIEELTGIVAAYVLSIQGVSENAATCLADLKELLNSPTHNELQRISPQLSAQSDIKAVSRSYSLIQTLIRKHLETNEDYKTRDKLTRILNVARKSESDKKASIIRCVHACEDAQVWLEKYRERQRTEAVEQLKQLREIPETAKLILSELNSSLGEL